MAAISRGRLSLSLPFYSRSFCAVASKPNSRSPQTGIPIIIPPHVIKKANIVHPKSRAVHPLLKHQWLTKTVFEKGLPFSSEENQEQTQLAPEVAQLINERFGGSLAQTLGFQKPPNKTKKRFEEEIRYGIFQDLVRLCSGNLTDTFVDVCPKVLTHWVRKHEFYQLEFYPDVILRSGTEWDAYLEDFQNTEEMTLPGPYDPYSMEVYKQPIVHLKNFPGFHAASSNPFPHNHTMFLANAFGQRLDQTHAFGIMSMFGVLASTAMSRGVKPGEHLSEPVCTQCVITDGRQLVLMCYQLNTMSLQEDHGVKNLAWGTDYMDLFKDNASEKGHTGLFGSLNIDQEIPSVNEDSVRRLLFFLCC
ncbi:39S ribosomal protein S30, mitochondrial [Nematostella vectensis]|uniref:39S ribosomal protein S30, mitochondrial n=1 Tax=Nematostella vectensis TaxID=45351 RepID=UPI0020773078|nr:39S ribosomal protein S30, mitochondrial [Nematostella vectensis]